jgi:Late competence development protein ComFB.
MEADKLAQTNDSDLYFSNVLEDIVKARTDKLIAHIDMCKCDRCRFDACAKALNSLAPKYVTTSKGALLSQAGYINLDHRTEIDVQVIKALKLVKENPRHDFIDPKTK